MLGNDTTNARNGTANCWKVTQRVVGSDTTATTTANHFAAKQQHKRIN